MRLVLAAVLSLAPVSALAQDCRVAFAPGQAEAAIRDVQAQLQAHGFNPGPVDGKLGPKTCGAVRAYQRAAGLPIDGLIDPKLQNHMHFVAPKSDTKR
ncbi:MAG: peptidoglycan-binding protein [Rhodospirillales bacterium]|nr:peptidoglycan-binding protein [Rhodospirillales bacterium]